MKKFFLSASSHSLASDLAALILRVGFGILMIPSHGYAKLVSFNEKKDTFMDFLGLGGPLSLSLTIFAEVFCSVLLILGLLTRLATIPLLITIFVIFTVHNWELIGKYELVTAFLVGYLTIFFQGSGKFSLDYLIFKKGR